MAITIILKKLILSLPGEETLAEGLAFLRPLHLVFVTPFGERFSMKGGGLRFLGLLPFTRSYISHRIPIGVTASGVYVLREQDPTEAARFERESFQFIPFDQLTVAASTLNRDRLVSIVRSELYGIAHATKSCDGESWREYWKRRRTTILGLLKQVELSESEVLRSPARKDPIAARFCPACEMEYLDRARACTECQFDLVELNPK